MPNLIERQAVLDAFKRMRVSYTPYLAGMVCMLCGKVNGSGMAIHFADGAHDDPQRVMQSDLDLTTTICKSCIKMVMDGMVNFRGDKGRRAKVGFRKWIGQKLYEWSVEKKEEFRA